MSLDLDPRARGTLIWLRATQKDSSKPPSRRMQAFYIMDFYEHNRNDYHLMAQVHAMCRGELFLPRPIAYNPDWQPSNLAQRCARHVEDTVLRFEAIPTLADFEGHPIKLLNRFPKSIETSLEGEARFQMHRAMVAYERLAEEQLARLVKMYGYHYILHAGLRQFFMV